MKNKVIALLALTFLGDFNAQLFTPKPRSPPSSIRVRLPRTANHSRARWNPSAGSGTPGQTGARSRWHGGPGHRWRPIWGRQASRPVRWL